MLIRDAVAVNIGIAFVAEAVAVGINLGRIERIGTIIQVVGNAVVVRIQPHNHHCAVGLAGIECARRGGSDVPVRGAQHHVRRLGAIVGVRVHADHMQIVRTNAGHQPGHGSRIVDIGIKLVGGVGQP